MTAPNYQTPCLKRNAKISYAPYPSQKEYFIYPVKLFIVSPIISEITDAPPINWASIH